MISGIDNKKKQMFRGLEPKKYSIRNLGVINDGHIQKS